jgi:hypothetical protein
VKQQRKYKKDARAASTVSLKLYMKCWERKKNDIGIVLLMQEGTTLTQIMFNKLKLACITF